MRLVRPLLLLAFATLAAPVAAQDGAPVATGAGSPRDTTEFGVRQIYASSWFKPETFGPARWLEGGAAYTTVEKAADGRGQDLVRYATETGARSVLVSAADLTPPGDTLPLAVEDYAWSPDGSKLLVFTNAKPVWRFKDRGDYWLLDRTTRTLRQLGGAGVAPSSLRFAKFSPDGARVGYLRQDNNIHVEDLASGRIVQLTSDGSRTVINGSFDWVYEEELDLRDGWRWSPDGRRVAYWQLVADRVRDFPLINTTDSLYAFVVPIQYPKAGEENSAARVGVVSADGAGQTRWVALDGDPRNHYPARMEWAANSREIAIQRLNRLQNTAELLLADATTGAPRRVLLERDSTWVDVVD